MVRDARKSALLTMRFPLSLTDATRPIEPRALIVRLIVSQKGHRRRASMDTARRMGPGLRRDDLLKGYACQRTITRRRAPYSIGLPVIAESSRTRRSDIWPVIGSLRSRSNFWIAAWVSEPTVPVGFSWP